MVGSSKILTVSYGTFSCTLEGFDDSFSTMKAIAEYFRDLAADDRYFGAEPPTPDAEMLARIAEREVTHRVEARTGEDGSGVVLKAATPLVAMETASAVADVADADPVEHVAETPAQKPVASDPAETADVVESPEIDETPSEAVEAEPNMPPAAEAPATAAAFSAPTSNITDTYEEDEEAVAAAPTAAAVDASEIGHPDADSVAAKLQRIRAVVSRSATPSSEETPDSSLFSDADTATEDDGDALAMSLSDIMAEEVDSADNLDVAADAGLSDAAEQFAEADGTDIDDAFEETADLQEQVEVAAQEEDEPAPVRARVIRMRSKHVDEPSEESIADSVSDNDMADEADDIAEAVENAALVEDDYGTSFDDLGASAEAEQEAVDAQELEKLDGNALAEAALSTLDPNAEAALQAELAALNGGEDLYPDAAPLRLDTPIADAVAEVAETTDAAADEVEALEEETTPEAADLRPRRVQLPGGPDDADSAMTRIMSETEAQMAAPDTSRRRDAIAQLKAAVAATEAERDAGDAGGAGDTNDEASFRDDLAQVVRPTRPIRPSRPMSSGAEPAPLKLVASQRVDEEDAAAAAAALGLTEDVAAETAPVANLSGATEATGFEAFAQQMGANDLTDLLEAAAAYTAFVEGAEDFSRPQLMSKVKEMSGEEYSREEGLRAFGTLLRQGQINKVRNGRFQISGDTRFHPERRAG